jgi:hypothetical protein
MAEIDRSMMITPPLSESGDLCAGGCPISENGINNPSTGDFPPSPASSIRNSGRKRNSLQKEQARSKQFTNRLQRSSTTGSDTTDFLRRKQGRDFRRQTNSLPADHGLKAIEPPHEQALTKMAFAEQQKWITVQQKTFTKWYERSRGSSFWLQALTREQVEYQDRATGTGCC